MNFKFPSIGNCCLICGESGCARWKGYFVRCFICINESFAGPLAVHVGHCRKMGTDFSYMPDFFIPGRKLSRPTLKAFVESFQAKGDIKTSIDELIARVPIDDFTLALSTAYEWLYQGIRALRLNAGILSIKIGMETVVSVLRCTSASALNDLFVMRLRWHPAHHMHLYPP